MAMTFSWNSKTDTEKKFVADQKRDLVGELKAKKVAAGEAVSTKKDRVDPTVGGNILRSTIKPTATLLARPVQLVKALQGKSIEDQTIKSKYLGDIKTSTNAKDVVKDVGRGLETVSLGLGLGAAKGATTAANIAKSALEGAASGYLQGVGHGIEEGKKLKDVAKEGIISTGVGALGGAALAGVSKLFSWNKPKITTPAGDVTKAEKAALTKSAEKRAFGETGKAYIPPAAKAPVVEKRVVLNKDGTPVPKEVQVAPQGNVVTKKGNVAPQITVGEVPKEKVTTAKKVLKQAYNDIPAQQTGGNLDEIAANTAKLLESDPDRAYRIAMGKELPRFEDGVTPDAVYRIVSANADGEKALELARSPVPSRSGINLVTNKLGERGSLTDKIREINGVLSKTLDKKQSKAAIEELTTAIRETAPSKEEIQSLIDELTCK